MGNISLGCCYFHRFLGWIKMSWMTYFESKISKMDLFIDREDKQKFKKKTYFSIKHFKIAEIGIKKIKIWLEFPSLKLLFFLLEKKNPQSTFCSC